MNPPTSAMVEPLKPVKAEEGTFVYRRGLEGLAHVPQATEAYQHWISRKGSPCVITVIGIQLRKDLLKDIATYNTNCTTTSIAPPLKVFYGIAAALAADRASEWRLTDERLNILLTAPAPEPFLPEDED